MFNHRLANPPGTTYLLDALPANDSATNQDDCVECGSSARAMADTVTLLVRLVTVLESKLNQPLYEIS
jgi:hypothetical protein